MRVTPSHTTTLRWATITLALLAGLSECLALLRARRRQQVTQNLAPH